jgi:hypothetical protein
MATEPVHGNDAANMHPAHQLFSNIGAQDEVAWGVRSTYSNSGVDE